MYMDVECIVVLNSISKIWWLSASVCSRMSTFLIDGISKSAYTIQYIYIWIVYTVFIRIEQHFYSPFCLYMTVCCVSMEHIFQKREVAWQVYELPSFRFPLYSSARLGFHGNSGKWLLSVLRYLRLVMTWFPAARLNSYDRIFRRLGSCSLSLAQSTVHGVVSTSASWLLRPTSGCSE